MKEYCTLVIKCKKELKLEDIFSFAEKKVQYNRNIFSFQNVHHRFISAKQRKYYEALHLEEYEYSIPLKTRDLPMVSNLDERWLRCNGEKTNSLNGKEWADLIGFASLQTRYDAYSYFLGIDEIMWDGSSVEKGTYGLEKADSCYGLGYGYLSNCLIAGKKCNDKTFTVILCCEKKYRSLDIFAELIDYFGELKHEISLFAPENEAERAEWNHDAMVAKQKYQAALLGIRSFANERIPNTRGVDEKVKINIQKQIKNVLCADGWKIRKAHFDEYPTVVCKEKGDAEISLSLISGHNGHHLQAFLNYRSKKFSFSDDIHELFMNELDESLVDHYFAYTKKILDYVYNVL